MSDEVTAVGDEATAVGDEATAACDAQSDSAAQPSIPRRRRRWIAAFLLVPLFGLLAGFAVDWRRHEGRVLRGVLLAGIDVGDKTAEEVTLALAPLEQRLIQARRVLTLRDTRRELRPVELGFALDRVATIELAMQRGRAGGWLRRFRWWLARLANPESLSPVARIDEAKLGPMLTRWAAEAIDDPPFEGAVIVAGGVAKVDPPRAGTVIDRQATRETLLRAWAAHPGTPIAVPLQQQAPRRNRATIEAATVRAQKWLSAPLTLTAELPIEAPQDEGRSRARRGRKRDTDAAEPQLRKVELTVNRDVLAAALKSKLTDGDAPGIAIYFAPKLIDFAIESVRRSIERPALDARFEISRGGKISISASRPARVLLADKVAIALQRAADTPERRGVLPVSVGAAPKLSSEQARALGIVKRVSKFTTVHPCCQGRVKNIHRMAELVDSTLIRPGEIFSLNELVGERRRSGGFVPAPTIVHGKMKDTVGGGVSQFATTFFNAAFYGAYEIIERQPHSYYFRRYPMGHEATLSFPKPDVIIRNDTAAGLLIKCEYGPTYITVKMYGDNGGRKVKRKVARIENVLDPPVVFEADPTMDPDDEKVLARGQHGWSVVVSRIMTMPDGDKKVERRRVTYKPRERKLRVHPCMIPEGFDGHTGKKCPSDEKDGDEKDGEKDGDEGGAGGGEAGIDTDKEPPIDVGG
jgi:vancomycin resistance protein YoaR